jgi:hypothetical protein
MPSLKSAKLKMEGPDTTKKGGPGKSSSVSLGKEHKVKGFTLHGPDKAGGGWVKKG